jgi:hypothetical protein
MERKMDRRFQGDLGPKISRDAIIEAATRIINPNIPQAIYPLARLHS